MQNPPKKPPATVTANRKRSISNTRSASARTNSTRPRREDGHELDDWLRAEEEVTKKNALPIAA